MMGYCWGPNRLIMAGLQTVRTQQVTMRSCHSIHLEVGGQLCALRSLLFFFLYMSYGPKLDFQAFVASMFIYHIGPWPLSVFLNS